MDTMLPYRFGRAGSGSREPRSRRREHQRERYPRQINPALTGKPEGIVRTAEEVWGSA